MDISKLKFKADIMDENAMKRALRRIAHEIIENNDGVENLRLVGIQRRGVTLAKMLREKKTYLEIAEKTGASTATISRVNRSLNYGNDGYDMVLDRLNEE